MVQLALAARLATVTPTVAEALSSLGKALVCAALAFTPALIASGLGMPRPVVWVLAAVAVWMYLRFARRFAVLTGEERARILQSLGGHGLARGLAWWMP